MTDSELLKILEKWHETKEKLNILEERLSKYKAQVAKEMNKRSVDKLSAGNFTVSRKRSTRTYLSKESVPESIWKEYATKCSFDVFTLVRK